MMITEPMHVSKPTAEPARRIEVFTAAGRRRSRSIEDKAGIVAECGVEGETVSAVARRHGLTAQQLFGWRRAVLGSKRSKATMATFVPAIVEVAPAEPGVRRRSRKSVAGLAMIELEIDGVTVRVNPGAAETTIAAVIRALKAGG